MEIKKINCKLSVTNVYVPYSVLFCDILFASQKCHLYHLQSTHIFLRPCPCFLNHMSKLVGNIHYRSMFRLLFL